VVSDVPAVGEGLQDHLLVPVIYFSRRILTTSHRAPNAMHGWANTVHTLPSGHQARYQSHIPLYQLAGSAKSHGGNWAVCGRLQLLLTDARCIPDLVPECALPRYALL
jgi:hypothetical protein